MKAAFNFPIQASGIVSWHFLTRGITNFVEAAAFTRRLPYRPNTDKTDVTCIFRDNGGTCGPKHAALRQLALENDRPDLRLKLGMFRMSAQNTPAVAATLDRYGLPYLPEAHNYLRVGSNIWDCTALNSSGQDFEDDLMMEVEIEPCQIADSKVAFHHAYLERWLAQNPTLGLSMTQLWAVREQCIRDLSANLATD
jgi:hypothetical protein